MEIRDLQRPTFGDHSRLLKVQLLKLREDVWRGMSWTLIGLLC